MWPLYFLHHARPHLLRRWAKLHQGRRLINMMLKYRDTSSALAGYNTLCSAHREVLICMRFNFWMYYARVIAYDRPDVQLIRTVWRKIDRESCGRWLKRVNTKTDWSGWPNSVAFVRLVFPEKTETNRRSRAILLDHLRMRFLTPPEK